VGGGEDVMREMVGKGEERGRAEEAECGDDRGKEGRKRGGGVMGLSKGRVGRVGGWFPEDRVRNPLDRFRDRRKREGRGRFGVVRHRK
jgi:hypothetical protein